MAVRNVNLFSYPMLHDIENILFHLRILKMKLFALWIVNFFSHSFEGQWKSLAKKEKGRKSHNFLILYTRVKVSLRENFHLPREKEWENNCGRDEYFSGGRRSEQRSRPEKIPHNGKCCAIDVCEILTMKKKVVW